MLSPISTGCGASPKLLEGKVLRGVTALEGLGRPSSEPVPCRAAAPPPGT